ncbi:phosphatase PAP2 family protein [Haloarcula sp. GH36]|uniref:phosphatase PAP2 family protein n=1 Tax=Haloarcula montana TaxID=3111776 RepID=UPI002D7962A6|nr:phosphatase PAP2 family protein [Haloarcula sp. GH36]
MREFLSELLAWVLELDAATVDVVLAVRNPVLTKLMTSVTGLGSASAAAVFLGLCYVAGWQRERRVGTIALLLSGIVVVSLMALVQRPFPPQPVCLTDGASVAPHSFPSGHAAAVTVFALVAGDSERLPTGVVAGIATLVAVSRIYLGTHFLSDTVVGVLIGVGAVVVATWSLDRYGWPSIDLGR